MKKSFLLIMACFFWFFQYSHAQLLTHDGFDIDLGAEGFVAASGKTTGFGWGAAWDIQGSEPGYQFTNATPLIYPGLASSPNYFRGGGAYTSSGRQFDTSAEGAFKDYLTFIDGRNKIGANGSTLYLSFLARNLSGTYRFGLSSGTPWSWSPQYFSVENIGTKFRLTMNEVNHDTDIDFNLNEVYLVVVKLEFDDVNGNSVSFWVNPGELGGTEPAPDFSFTETTPTNIAFESMHWYPNNGNNQGHLDEIRFGVTYTDVTPKSPALISFNFLDVNPVAVGVIDYDLNTIQLEVPFQYDLASLVPTILLSPGVSIDPVGGVANDFTNPVIYTVTDPELGDIDYTVTVDKLPANDDNTLKNFSISMGAAVIDQGAIDHVNETVTLDIPTGIGLTFTVNFQVHMFAQADIVSGSTVNLENVTQITVTAQNGEEKTYSFVINELFFPTHFADDFSTDENFSGWQGRNWNNSGGSSQYQFAWEFDEDEPQASYLKITKTAAINDWIRFVLPETVNLGTPGAKVRMRVSSAETINNFGLKLQDVNAPTSDGNFSVATGTISAVIEGDAGYKELIWDFSTVLNTVNPYLIKYLVLQADRTNNTVFTDIRLDDLRVGYDAYANNPPTHNPITHPGVADMAHGIQSVTITGITDGNPEREEVITVTATSNNQLVVKDENINVIFDEATGVAVIEYAPSLNGNAEIVVVIQDDRGTLYTDESDTKTLSFLARFISTEPGVNNPASFGIPSFTHVNVGAGNQHFVIISDVDDGYIHDDQEIFFSYLNNSPEMITIDSIVYNPGDNYALLYFHDNGVTGNASVTVSAIDEVAQAEGDDPFELTFNIPLSIYNTFGANYGATQVAFWQPMPYKTEPAFMPGYPIILNEAYAQDDPALDFFWGKMWGYIIPPVSTQYRFYTSSDPSDNAEWGAPLYLSTDASQANIPAENNPTAKMQQPSGFIELEAGKAYYFEAFNREIINEFFLRIEWEYEGSGGRKTIAPPNIFYFLDQVLPGAPSNLRQVALGSEQVAVEWDAATDNIAVAGYKVYINGVAYNHELFNGTAKTITGLQPGKDYDIFVLAVDNSNNYSNLSNVLRIKTYGEDNNPPSVPTGLAVIESTSFSITMQWNEAVDDETSIFGYNLYLNGSTEPVNETPVYNTSWKISPLNISTEYSVTVTALDAALNESDPSPAVLASTNAFEWDNPAEDLYVGLVSFELESIAPATGIAIEASPTLGSIFLSNKVPHGSYEDSRFVNNISIDALGVLGLERSAGTNFQVETTNVHHGSKSAKLLVSNNDWLRHVTSIIMNPGYNYRLSFAAKREANYAGGNINLRVFRDVGGVFVAYTGSVTPTEDWTEYVIEFPGIQDASTSWKVEFGFTRLGTVYLDDVQLHVKEWYNPGSKFTKPGLEILDELKPAGIRWGAIDANSKKFFESTGAYQKRSMTLADFAYLSSLHNGYALLTAGVRNDTDWKSDPTTFTKFIEYLNGPAGTTWGDERIAEGYTQPFSETLNGIILEMGNEVWGFNAHDADGFGDNYVTYTNWAADMSQNYMKNSPWYDHDKMYVSFSGRSPDLNYGLHNSLFTNEKGQMDMLSISGYLGGNMNYDPAIPVGQSQLDYHKNSYANFLVKINGLHQIFEEMLQRGMNRVVPQYMYEGNLTRNEYHGTAGQAVTMMDYYATVLKNGVTLPNAFALEGGQWRLIENQVSLARRPFYRQIQYFNSFCKDGEILKTSFNTIRSIRNDNGQVINLPTMGVHAYHHEGQYGLALFSRDFENDYVVKLELPEGVGQTSNGKMVVISSSSYSSLDVSIAESSIDVEDGMLITIPKHSSVFISFDGNVQNLEQKPLGYFNYQKVEQLVVTPRDGTTTLDGPTSEIFLDIEILPANAFYRAWGWEWVDNSAVLMFTRANRRVYPRASSVNGTSVIRFFTMDGTNLSKEVEITAINLNVGMEEMESQGIAVFPNPAKDEISLYFNSEVAKAKFEIFSMQGAMLMEGSLIGKGRIVDISGLKAGMYLIRVIVDDQIYTTRIMKN